MIVEDMIGDVIDLDGRTCQILAAAPRASNGNAVLFLVSVAVEREDGRHRHGAIPIVAIPAPGNLKPRIIRPVAVFDAGGEFVPFKRPIADHVGSVRWVGTNGEPTATSNGWPIFAPRRLSELDQVRAALDRAPGLDEEELKICGRLTRLCGVPVLDRDGNNRDPNAIRADAVERLEVLRRGRAPPAIIGAVEAMIARGGTR